MSIFGTKNVTERLNTSKNKTLQVENQENDVKVNTRLYCHTMFKENSENCAEELIKHIISGVSFEMLCTYSDNKTHAVHKTNDDTPLKLSSVQYQHICNYLQSMVNSRSAESTFYFVNETTLKTRMLDVPNLRNQDSQIR